MFRFTFLFWSEKKEQNSIFGRRLMHLPQLRHKFKNTFCSTVQLYITRHCFSFVVSVSISSRLVFLLLLELPLLLLFAWPSFSPYLARISSRFFSLSAFRLACWSCRLALAAAFFSWILRSSFSDIPSSPSWSSLSSHPKFFPTEDNLFETTDLAM